jgi:hypothetical protein
MSHQRYLLIRAIGYLTCEMIFLLIAIFGKSSYLPQPVSSYWITYGGLAAAVFCGWMAYGLFYRWFALREHRRQLEKATHGST